MSEPCASLTDPEGDATHLFSEQRSRGRAMHETHIRATAAATCAAAAALMLTLHASAVAAIVDESGEAVARLAPTKGSTAAGTATFSSAGKDGVRITIEVSGLKPNAEHGLHVHEKGDCSAPDATSAGPHFSLQGQEHGPHEGGKYHAGDLGNLSADAQGKATKTLVVPSEKLTLTAGPASVVGKAVVVHGGPDDLKSQPAGNSGPRIACGVVDRQAAKNGTLPTKTPAK
jgi:superoxide dismutase, Cu-Zn family